MAGWSAPPAVPAEPWFVVDVVEVAEVIETVIMHAPCPSGTSVPRGP
ncbi:hypothetical protein BN2537_10065 [Streptomyces venezuelae]|nr:hypothetical protein BN2537_10065 [Streptomyces venezuelae]